MHGKNVLLLIGFLGLLNSQSLKADDFDTCMVGPESCCKCRDGYGGLFCEKCKRDGFFSFERGL